jgi:RNA polymerase sigma-70 factor (ECF subfamily)
LRVGRRAPLLPLWAGEAGSVEDIVERPGRQPLCAGVELNCALFPENLKSFASRLRSLFCAPEDGWKATGKMSASGIRAFSQLPLPGENRLRAGVRWKACVKGGFLRDTNREDALADLLKQAQAGDRDAWGEIYRQYAPVIFRFCRRALPTREDAEDATTEIFMKVRQKLTMYDSSRPFTAWLYKVASNHCWDQLRRRRIRQDLEIGEIETLPLQHPDPGQLERLLMDQDSKQLRAGLAKLPDRARMALVLRYYSEMSYDEIAETLGVQRAFVGVLLLRARHQLRDVLTGRGESPVSPWKSGSPAAGGRS